VKTLPSRLEPVLTPRIWGAHSLAPLFPEYSALKEAVGEVWLTGDDCLFADGPFAGRRLADAWKEFPEEWAGESAPRSAPFPLLVKFLFPEDKLSVQVHPDDDYARRHEAPPGVGKTEMWYAVTVRPPAEVLVNLKLEVQKEQFRRAIAEGTVEECLERTVLRAGDVVFVPAGTVHTIGPGVTLCEIQQNSDLTYRVFDYNRLDAEGKPRPLHIEKALDVIHFGEQDGGKIEPVRLSRGGLAQSHYVACRYFVTEKWEFSERIAAATSKEHFDLLIFIEGCGAIECCGEALPYAPAQAWLVPASLGAYQIAPASSTSLLRTYVPVRVADVARRLADQGVPESAWSRLIYP
jgi:mannose-6-phosphate isomerase